MRTPIEKNLKKRIALFRAKFGRHRAEKILREAGLSLSITQKLLADSYPHQPQGLQLIAINNILQKEKV